MRCQGYKMRIPILVGVGLALAGCHQADQVVSLEACSLDAPQVTIASVDAETLRLADGVVTFTDDNGNTVRHIPYGAGIAVCYDSQE
jgi:hypothetical protein